MSEYHYKYDPPRGGRNNRSPGGGDPIGALIELVLSVLVAIPMGIAFLVKQVVQALSGEGSSGSAARPQTGFGQSPAGQSPTGQPSNLHQVQRPAAGQSAPAPKKDKDGKKVSANDGRGLTVLGGILTGVFGVAFLTCLAEAASVAGIIATGALAGAGLLTLLFGLRRRRKAKLYLKYLGLIGRRESVNLTTLAKAAGRSRKKVCGELQDMLDKGILPTGYLDLAGDRLVLSEKGIEDAPVEEAEAPKSENDDNAILREIREVNDSIPDPVMSAKIDRIGEITAKILDHQRTHPGKASQTRSFLNYYLPTTLKILRAYAQLDQQGVEGENISAAKARIEGMMDKVVEGFEKQLDRLFQDDAMDITSDVAVLEQMLENDGLGSGEGLTLGGT